MTAKPPPSSQTPNDANLLNDYGVYHLRREQWALAETWFRKSLAAQPSHQRAAVNLAISLGMQNRMDESYDTFSQVVGSAAAYSNLGVLLARQGRANEARDHFFQATALDASLRPAQVQLARLGTMDLPQNHAETSKFPVQPVQYSTTRLSEY